jgi:hypothetical protein
VWLGVAIDTVAVKPMTAFRGLRLSWVLGIVLLCLPVVPGLLVTPMALPGIIGVVLPVEAAKQPCQIFSIPETFLDDRGSVGVGQDVFVKPTVVG